MKLSDIFNWTSAQGKVEEEQPQVSILNLRNVLEHEEKEKTNKMSNPTIDDYEYGATIAMEIGTDPVSAESSTSSEGNVDKDNTLDGPRNWIEDGASLVDSVFSDVRSVEEHEAVEETNESNLYRHSSSLQRAMPERLFALTITMLLEIPVLMMVSGGSEALCTLIGRSRYQLLVGFLPLTSAISGNVGLQSSTLTTRAISHSHVTVKDYGLWLSTEIGAAMYLALGMGTMLGTIAYVASGLDLSFGLTICVSQMLSIVTAGLTGTIAPLLFSFLFKRDAGKWGGPLETAVQDIVGSFAMVIVSYHLLLFLGTGPIDPNDVCGPTRI